MLVHYKIVIQVMRESLANGLRVACTKGYTSIALPAIGTGGLQFPSTVVANIMFDTVINFSKANPGSSLKEVRFALYHLDQVNIDVRR